MYKILVTLKSCTWNWFCFSLLVWKHYF